MGKKNDDFFKQLRETFRIEADEHLKATTTRLLELEKAPAGKKQLELLGDMFREVHSLKGAARAVDEAEIEAVCQSLENVFARWKHAKMIPSPQVFDPVHWMIDTLGALLSGQEGSAGGVDKSELARIEDQLARLEAGEANKEAEPELPPKQSPKAVLPPLAEGRGPQQEESDRTERTGPGGEAVRPRTVTPDRAAAAPPHDVWAETVRVPTARLEMLMRNC